MNRWNRTPIAAALVGLTAIVAIGAKVPRERPADVVAMRVEAPPAIDGILKDGCWLQIAKARKGVMAGWVTPGGGRLVQQQRIAYVCYDEACLYIGMQAFTPDVFKLKTGPAGRIWAGDCLEIHINPSGEAYLQWGIDINGEQSVGGASTRNVDECLVKGATSFGENFWVAELAIPWEVVGVKPERGARMGFNLCANRAYQGAFQRTSPITWHPSYRVKNYESILELE